MNYRTLAMYGLRTFQLESGFELVFRIVDPLFKESLLESFNFNRYGSEDSSRISLRLNLTTVPKGETRTDELAKRLQTEGLIDSYAIRPYGETVDEGTRPKPSREVTIEAGEAATELAIAFYTGFKGIENRHIRFDARTLSFFWAISLKEAGFRSYWLEYDLADPDILSETMQLVDRCQPIFHRSIPDNPTAGFMERFLHLFLNCLTIHGQSEAEVTSSLLFWHHYGTLAESDQHQRRGQ